MYSAPNTYSDLIAFRLNKSLSLRPEAGRRHTPFPATKKLFCFSLIPS
jgi:hypothetical protein